MEALMTEDEAKKKWCPMVRGATFGVAFVNNRFEMRFNPEDSRGGAEYVTCIGSACMMWRWDWSPGDVRDFKKNHPGEECPELDGRCGLAGESLAGDS